MSIFERYLTVWVGLCIVGGILLGRIAPEFAHALDGMAIHVNGAPVVSIPIAICLFLMMYPAMLNLQVAELKKLRDNPKPILLSLFSNWIFAPAGSWLGLSAASGSTASLPAIPASPTSCGIRSMMIRVDSPGRNPPCVRPKWSSFAHDRRAESRRR